MSNLIKFGSVLLALSAGFIAAKWLNAPVQPTDLKALDDYCVVSSQTCVQQNVTIKANSDTVHPLIPSQLSVTWVDTAAKQLLLTLEGREMEMGKVKFILNRTSGDQFQGEVILPVCTSDEMTWVGELSDGSSSVKTAIRMKR